MSPRRIEDYDESWLKRQTPLGLFLKLVGAMIVVALVCGGVGWVGGWFKTGAEVVGPANVKAQWQFAYDYNESLRAIASNWCTLRKEELAVGQRGDADALNQRSSQRLATETNYDKTKAEYDGRLRDAFRAGLVAPPDVPKTAPTLQEKLAEIGCTQQQS